MHLKLCELQATYRLKLIGLLLPSCLIVVSLLGGVWNSGTAPAGVYRCSNVVFENIVFKISSTSNIRVSNTVLKLLCTYSSIDPDYSHARNKLSDDAPKPMSHGFYPIVYTHLQ